MIRRGVGFDTESHLIRPGCQAPSAVCMSWVDIHDNQLSRPYLVGGKDGRHELVHRFVGWLETPSVVLYGANTAFDCLTITTLCAELYGYDAAEELLVLIFNKYRLNGVADVLTRSKMIDLSAGCYRGYTGSKGKWVHYGYNLGDLLHRFTGKQLEKDTPDSWRKRFGSLANTRLCDFPADAVDYTYGDAVGTGTIACIQEDIPEATRRNFPGMDPLANQWNEARGAWWLKLCSVWGIRTNAKAVERFALNAQQSYLELAEGLSQVGPNGEPELVWKEYKLHRDELVKHITRLGKLDRITIRGPLGESKLRLAQDTLLSVGDPLTSLAMIWRHIKAGLEEPAAPGDQAGLAKYSKAREAYIILENAGLAETIYHKKTKAASQRMIETCFRLNREPRLTDTGEIALTKDICSSLGDPLLESYADLTSLSKTVSTDIPALRGGAYMPIHTRYEEYLDTSRTSSSNPNIQNIKRIPGQRECYIPRAGCVIVDADYRMLELFTLAQLCLWKLGYSSLAQALNAGEDAHLKVGATLLGMPYDQALLAYRREDPRVLNGRDCGKVGNFGIPGGLGAETLVMYALKSYGVRITKELAQQIKKNYLETWVEMGDYFKYVSSCETYPGSGSYNMVQPWSNRLRADATFCSGCNDGFQGLGASVAKLAGWYLAEAMYTNKRDALYGCRMINFIHDQFLIEAREDIANDAAKSTAYHMNRAAAEILVDVPTTASVLLSRVWSKKAKKIEINGVLLPWEPKEVAA